MPENQVKVLLQEDENIETLWADPVGPNLYRLDNCPFWAYGVSWRDVVQAAPDPDGMLRMKGIVEKSGHRTLRVIFDPGLNEDPTGRAVLVGAVARGCTYEGMNPRYVVIDLPPEVDLMEIAEYLTRQGVLWEHADPRHSDLYPDEE